MMSDKDFEVIAGKNRQRLTALAQHYLKNKEDAEDATQEVLLRLWLYRSSLRHEKNINGLLTTMMRNHCVSMLKKVSPPTVPLEQCDTDTGVNALQWLEEKQDNELLRKAVASLSQAERRLFVMRQQAGMEIGQIAALTNSNPRSVSAVVSAARRKVLNYIINNQ